MPNKIGAYGYDYLLCASSHLRRHSGIAEFSSGHTFSHFGALLHIYLAFYRDTGFLADNL